MLALDGRCKVLDAAADGYVRAEACGVLVLSACSPEGEPLARDEHAAAAPALAYLAGSAVGQDGRSSSLTAPNGPAQQAVIRSALSSAGLQPGQVAGISGHLTGTPLGDPLVSVDLVLPSTSGTATLHLTGTPLGDPPLG